MPPAGACPSPGSQAADGFLIHPLAQGDPGGIHSSCLLTLTPTVYQISPVLPLSQLLPSPLFSTAGMQLLFSLDAAPCLLTILPWLPSVLTISTEHSRPLAGGSSTSPAFPPSAGGWAPAGHWPLTHGVLSSHSFQSLQSKSFQTSLRPNLQSQPPNPAVAGSSIFPQPSPLVCPTAPVPTQAWSSLA